MPAHQRYPEQVRQSWLHKFFEAVVLPPCEIRGIDQAGAAKANDASRFAAIGRGCKSGTPDHFIWQGAPPIFVAVEIKHKSSASPAQEATAKLLRACGFPVIENCRTTADALTGLRAAGVRLSANVDLQAVHYQAQMDGGLRALATPSPKKAARPRKPRDNTSKARIRRGAAIYAKELLS